MATAVFCNHDVTYPWYAVRRYTQWKRGRAAHLIWALRCERIMRKPIHSAHEIRARRLRVINERLTDDKLTATKDRREKALTDLVVHTWDAS